MTLIQEKPARAGTNGSRADLIVGGLRMDPAEVWQTMLRFSGPTPAEIDAMRQTVDVLFRRGYELVVGTYDHLQRNPETARVLGWERGMDERHLAERRRFFTIWLARTLSVDLGTDYARYLFRAGQIHAAHGPRRIHTPSMWVTGSMGLVLGAFAQFIREEHDDVKVVAPALAGWNKYLMIQLNQMIEGYETARELDAGDFVLPVKAYNLIREAWGRVGLEVHLTPGAAVVDALRKLLNYSPELRDVIFEKHWDSEIDERSEWTEAVLYYRLRSGWRILLNGKDLSYHGGFERVIQPGDMLEMAPPGR